MALIDVSQLNLLPYPNVGSQIERAIIALLRAFFKQMALPGLPVINFYFSNDWKPREAPLVEVLAHKSTEEIPHTRVERYMVKIEVKWPGANQPGQENLEYNWQTINQLIGVVMTALSPTQIVTGVVTQAPVIPVDIAALPRVVGQLVSQAGRALAVDGSGGQDQLQVQEAQNNADMVNFTCDFVEFKGSQRAESDGASVFIKEIRNFEVRACGANIN